MEQTENKYITVAYKMYMLEDGEKEFGEEATADNPFPFITGMGLTLEAFENAVKDLEEGDEFDFTIPCAEAYGEYDEEHVIELPKGIFLVDGKFDDEHIVPDAIVPLMTAEGQRVNGSVVEVKDDVVVMDMNHPLAGCDLQFTGHVVCSRPATAEEVAHIASVMAGGGCGGGCNGGCGGCGGGCNGGCGGCGGGCDDGQGCGDGCCGK